MPLALDTLIPTPTGWTSVLGLQPGDTVFDEMGQPAQVKRVSDPYLSPAMEVGFVTERSESPTPQSTLCAAPSQRLPVIKQRTLQYYTYPRTYKPDTISDRNETLPPQWPAYRLRDMPREKYASPNGKATAMFAPRPISELAERPRQTNQKVRTYNTATAPNWYLPTTRPLNLPSPQLRFDPYLYGLSINCRVHFEKYLIAPARHHRHLQAVFAQRGLDIVRIPTPRVLYEITKHRHVFELRERAYDLGHTLRTLDYTYLRASIEDRLALLSGYLDTTRHIKSHPAANRLYLFIPENKLALAPFLRELIISLGGLPYQHDYAAAIALNRPYKTDNYTQVLHTYLQHNPFTNPRVALQYRHLIEATRTPLYKQLWKPTVYVPKGDTMVKDVRVDSTYGLFLATESMLPVKDDT